MIEIYYTLFLEKYALSVNKGLREVLMQFNTFFDTINIKEKIFPNFNKIFHRLAVNSYGPLLTIFKLEMADFKSIICTKFYPNIFYVA